LQYETDVAVPSSRDDGGQQLQVHGLDFGEIRSRESERSDRSRRSIRQSSTRRSSGSVQNHDRDICLYAYVWPHLWIPPRSSVWQRTSPLDLVMSASSHRWTRPGDAVSVHSSRSIRRHPDVSGPISSHTHQQQIRRPTKVLHLHGPTHARPLVF
jgi:hypothetical protein